MSDYIDKVVGGFVALVVGGITWLIRRVVTNSKQIELLEKDIRRREEQRQEDREYLREMKKDFEKKFDIIHQEIRDIHRNHI